MAQNFLTDAELIANNNNNIPDNTAQAVLPESVRTQMNNLVYKAGLVATAFYNDTGVEIPKGRIINASGFDATSKILTGQLADPTATVTSSGIIGMSAAAVPDGEIGIAVDRGYLQGVDTSAVTAGIPLFLDPR